MSAVTIFISVITITMIVMTGCISRPRIAVPVRRTVNTGIPPFLNEVDRSIARIVIAAILWPVLIIKRRNRQIDWWIISAPRKSH